jgi:hypothetical protein
MNSSLLSKEFLKAWNEHPRPFVWTATIGSIVAKLAGYRQTLEPLASRSNVGSKLGACQSPIEVRSITQVRILGIQCSSVAVLNSQWLFRFGVVLWKPCRAMGARV